MEDMEKLTAFTKLLGEENEKKFRDRVTELLIEQVESDLENMYCYLIDFESMFEEIREDVMEDTKRKVAERYKKKVEEKFSELFENE